ncbi:MAG: ATP-binding protein [Flavobacteriaceae bacterium]
MEYNFTRFQVLVTFHGNFMSCVALFILTVYTLELKAQGQDHERGFLSVQNYSHETYDGHYQNWSVAQDKNGFIYTGNGNGILEYDGATWRLISAPGLQAVRSVVVDKDNVKWVGADRELGYLEADSLGFLQFKSLKDKIPTSNPLTGNVWDVLLLEEGVLFVVGTTIYKWKDKKFKIVSSPGPVYRQFQVYNRTYFVIRGKGIYEYIDDSLQLITNGDLFKDSKILAMLPYENDTILFAISDKGVFIFDGSELVELQSDVGDYFSENKLYQGMIMPDSTYLFITLRGGAIHIDNQGKRIRTITTEDGILNNQLHGKTLDDQGALWLALQTGVSRVEPYLPYTFFDERSGLEGTVSAITRHQGTLYVGTYSGLFALEPNSAGTLSRFSRISEIKSGCFSLLSVGDDLLAATSDGAFEILDGKAVQLHKKEGSRVLYRSKRDSNRVYLGHFYGLSSLYKSDGKWGHENDLSQIEDDIFSIASDNTGALWLGTSLHQVIKIDFPKKNGIRKSLDISDLRIERYEEGLPEGSTNAYLIDNEVFVTTSGDGGPLFKLNKSSGKFQRETQFGKKFGLDSMNIYPRGYRSDGRYVLLESTPVEGKRFRFSAFKNESGNYSIKRLYDERIRSTTETHVFWDHKDLLWIGGENITKYDLTNGFSPESSAKAYVRKVSIGQDSVIFGGTKAKFQRPLLEYTNNALRFEYASPKFMDSKANRFKYLLEGFDEDWSDWTLETKKDYTNLPSGVYQFRVKAIGIFGFISPEGSFSFEILPPWYLRWWAYVIYILFFVTLLYLLIQWRAGQLKAKNEALEKLIAVRTSEVQHQANQLKIQAEKLLELDKAKSRFFANISHEFRTPLTLIKGPIERLEQNFDEKLSAENVKMVRRNTNRLLNMVNQLLDLSKIDEGSLKLALTEGDAYKCLRAAASSFNSHAAQRNIDYRVKIPQSVLWASFDRDKVENIIYNLLGNAFKFSEDGSEIAFEASFEQQQLLIKVSDTGKGIPSESLPFIFERFYQVDGGNTREKEGSGIGLSLSKDLVELMDGTIEVTSKLGKGTYFNVRLPIQEIKTGDKKIVDDSMVPNRTEGKNSYDFTKADDRDLPAILLIEDNRDMRHFIAEQLIKFYRVIEATDGQQGLKRALANPPDLIITDLMMPKMDGIELCKKLKTDVNTSHIPVIMLTAKAGMENKIEGLETGADDYLTKPFDAKELLVRTKNLIEQRKKLRELYSNKEIQVDPKKVTVNSIDQKFLEKLVNLLEDNYSDAAFGVPQMQTMLGMSKTQLHRKLKALTNEAPGELLRNFRLKRAAQLLSQKADNVTQIAYQVGFNNLSYFAKCFKELYGVAPSAY